MWSSMDPGRNSALVEDWFTSQVRKGTLVLACESQFCLSRRLVYETIGLICFAVGLRSQFCLSRRLVYEPGGEVPPPPADARRNSALVEDWFTSFLVSLPLP